MGCLVVLAANTLSELFEQKLQGIAYCIGMDGWIGNVKEVRMELVLCG
jgi:hypothetical protein